MSELEEQPSGGISRRSVTKAMAWAVPVIAIAAPVPAFAASGGTLTLAGTGCKLPGNSNSIYKGYAFRLSANNVGNPDPVTFTIIAATLDGEPLGLLPRIVNLDNGNQQVNPFTIGAGLSLPNLALLTQNAPNSQQGALSITYTVAGVPGSTTINATIPTVNPINGASCSAFDAPEKVFIRAATGAAPAWQATHVYATGDTVTVGTATLVAQNPGTSGTTAPAVPGTVGGLTALDGNIIWQRVI